MAEYSSNCARCSKPLPKWVQGIDLWCISCCGDAVAAGHHIENGHSPSGIDHDHDPRTVCIDYTNYKGKRRSRRIKPEEFSGRFLLRFGTTPFHKEPQWLLEAIDVEKGPRTFAMKDIHSWRRLPDAAGEEDTHQRKDK